MLARLDHLAVSATRLEDGVAHVEAALGVPMAPGGAHPDMGTQNRLLRLGTDIYLEVIAVDPGATAPDRNRWFDLDGFEGPPRLTNWILRCPDLDGALAAAPPGAGQPLALRRGDLAWRMAVPRCGRLPFGDAYPALMEWQNSGHPAARLPDQGCRLVALEIASPQAAALKIEVERLIQDPRLSIVPGPARALRAEIDTPSGRRILE